MSYPDRTERAMARRRGRPFQQFGQPDDASTFGGATACTHTVLQFLATLWLGKWYSHDQVSKLAGYPSAANNPTRRGLRPSEVQRFCDAVKLPYVVKLNMSAFDMLEVSRRGPIGFGHSYSTWPEWYGFHYAGRVADGSPNGYARPFKAAGRTQLAGFVPPNDAHFGLLLGWDKTASSGAARVVAWEPNHGSGARPEKPPYDLMTSAQFRKVFESYQKVLHRTPYALIPTRYLPL